MYELRLSLDICFTIPRVCSRQRQLESRIALGSIGVRPQVIPEREVIGPEAAAGLRQMKVVLTRIAAPKEIAPWYPLFAAIRIPRGFEGVNYRLSRVTRISSRENVEHWLGDETGNSCAAGVLEHQRNSVARQHPVKSRRLRSVKFQPLRIVLRETNYTRFQTKRGMHLEPYVTRGAEV